MAFRQEALIATRRSRTEVDATLDDVTRNLTAAWVKAWDELAPVFDRAFRDLVSEASGDRVASRARIRKDERIQFAMGSVSRSLTHLMASTRAETLDSVQVVIKVGNESQLAIIAAQLPKGYPHLTESRSSDLADVFTRTSRRIAALTRAIPGRVDRAMRNTIARLAMARIRPGSAQAMLSSTEAAFNAGLAQALTISRTEALDAYRAASSIGRDINADVLRGWVWISRLDRRTCASCFAMHGSEHPLDESGPDDHQRGRCVGAPLTKTWKELGIDIGMEEPESLISSGLTVFRAMPRESQLQVLGPARLELLDRGEIEWGDLATERNNSGWRRSYVPTPVNQLIEG
jgi:hypothetical protein